ncbi:MAG: N-acetyl sugar amidotransferase [Dehalococcoidia bacterium]|nr:MAG: N-acetyl sugar amidotransferase [Dehalococcoidia bacterium]
MGLDFFYCKKCLMPSTRPRMTFNNDGVCNGCIRAEEKKYIIWDQHENELIALCDKYRGNGKDWDMIIPWSGGKDSYHIAYNMKEVYGMKPLLVKVAPLIPTRIGRLNEENIRDQGYDLIVIHPGREYVDLCKKGFIEQGRPQMGFVTGITTALVKLAMAYGIKWLMYGEEGETEYGGRTDYKGPESFNRTWIKDVYFSGYDTNDYEINSPWWYLPSQEELDKSGIFLTHWSYFSFWESEKHFETAKKMGFQYNPQPDEGVTGKGTFTNYTSLDDPYMRTLHTHLMFLKFGFGRGSHEATGEIRAGRMTREEGIELAEQYDNYDCRDYLGKYLKLFDMLAEQFINILDNHVNGALLVNNDGVWELRKDIHWGLTKDNPLYCEERGICGQLIRPERQESASCRGIWTDRHSDMSGLPPITCRSEGS